MKTISKLRTISKVAVIVLLSTKFDGHFSKHFGRHKTFDFDDYEDFEAYDSGDSLSGNPEDSSCDDREE